MRILLVDGEFQSRWVIAGALQHILDAAVDSAASGAEALNVIEKSTFDLVVLAHPLEEMSSFDLAQRIKARRQAPLVVIMTEASNPEFQTMCLAVGADSCLEKSQLLVRLLAFLRGRSATAASTA